MKKTIMLLALMALLLCFAVSASIEVPYPGDTEFKKPFWETLTLVGEQRGCSAFPDETYVFQLNREYYVLGLSCSEHSLVNLYKCVPGSVPHESYCNNGYSWIGEMEIGEKIYGLDPNSYYVYECYHCDELQDCGNSGDRTCVTEKTYAICDGTEWTAPIPCIANTMCDNGLCSNACTPSWQTGSWSDCKLGSRTREVWDSHNCNVIDGKPISQESCEDPTPKIAWTAFIIPGLLILAGLILAVLTINPGFLALTAGGVIWLIVVLI